MTDPLPLDLPPEAIALRLRLLYAWLLGSHDEEGANDANTDQRPLSDRPATTTATPAVAPLGSDRADAEEVAAY